MSKRRICLTKGHENLLYFFFFFFFGLFLLSLLIIFETIFVYGVRKWSNFIVLHVDGQLFLIIAGECYHLLDLPCTSAHQTGPALSSFVFLCSSLLMTVPPPWFVACLMSASFEISLWLLSGLFRCSGSLGFLHHLRIRVNFFRS